MAWLGGVEDCAQIELEGSLGNVHSWVLLSHEVDVAHRQVLQVNYWSFLLFWETWKLHKRCGSIHCTYWHSSTLIIMIIIVGITITTITIYIIITSHTMCLLSLHLVSCLMIFNDNTISNILFVKTILSNWYRASSSRRWRSCRGAPCKPARRTCTAGGLVMMLQIWRLFTFLVNYIWYLWIDCSNPSAFRIPSGCGLLRGPVEDQPLNYHFIINSCSNYCYDGHHNHDDNKM